MDDDDFQAQADVLGDPEEGMLGQADETREQAVRTVHERDVADLARMIRVREMHRESGCQAGGGCCGSALQTWLLLRMHISPAYPINLITSLVTVVAERDATISRMRGEVEEMSVSAMRLDVELGDARGRIRHLQEQVQACDMYPSDVRVWPEDRS